MLTAFVCAILLLPQIIAAARQTGPAAHLTLLLLSLCAVTGILAALSFRTADVAQPASRQLYIAVHLSPLGFAAIGLSLVTPLYWAVEQLMPNTPLEVERVLAQTLAMSMAAALWGGAPEIPTPLITTFALALIAALGLRGVSALWRARGGE